jgi:hypothetical protein
MLTVGKLEKGGLTAAAAGVAVCALGFLVSSAAFLEGYLIAYGYWLAISLGCLGLTLVHGLSGGRWGIELAPLLRAGMQTLPLMALLVVPIVLGGSQLYPWLRPDVVAATPLLQTKVAYLNQPFFLARLAVYFLTWIVFAFLVVRRPSGGVAGVGTLFLVLTVSFAAFDLYMSLEPLWFSSLYGGLYLVGCLVATFSWLAVLTWNLREGAAPDHWHDLGKFLLMSVMLWAYLNFSQYLILWSAKIPEEMEWYHHRSGAWSYLGLFLVVAHFAVPFCLLLSRQLKRAGKPLMYVAVGLLVMRFIDLWWWVSPALHPGRLSFPVFALAAFAAIGGIWCFLFARALKSGRHAAGGSAPGAR